MENKYFLSICIPSYNRPKTLKRLLDTIDSKRYREVQIVICEDLSPARTDIRATVKDFKKITKYDVKYVENEVNCGYDKNLRQLMLNADGEFLIYMGDDDGFIPGALDVYIEWLKAHSTYAYILRSYITKSVDGKVDYYRYFSEDKFFEAGQKTYETLFLKSVSISGFTIKRESILPFQTSDLDGCLLQQLYWVAEVCLKHPAAYCNTPCAQLISDDISYFGNSASEKGLYTPDKFGESDSKVNFAKQYLRVAKYVDEKYSINSVDNILTELSKYSYYFLSGQRKHSLKYFNAHYRKLKDLGFDKSVYFKIYYWGLLLFGAKFCTGLIKSIKRIYGRRLDL